MMFLLLLACHVAAQTIVAQGSQWKLTLNAAPVGDWHAPSYDTSGWMDAMAPIGYESDPPPFTTFATEIAASSVSGYVRTTVSVTAAMLNKARELELSVASDNSADVWFNGAVADDEATQNRNHNFVVWNRQLRLSVGLLKEGENVITAFITNPIRGNGQPSSDLYFDLQLRSVVCGGVVDECGICRGDGSTCTASFNSISVSFPRPSEAMILWSTPLLSTSMVAYGIGNTDTQQPGFSTSYVMGTDYTSQYIHVARLVGLVSGRTYSYKVGGLISGGASVEFDSNTYTFVMPRDPATAQGSTEPLCIAAFGQHGTTAASRAISSILANENSFKAAFLAGNMACASGGICPEETIELAMRLRSQATSRMPFYYAPGPSDKSIDGSYKGFNTRVIQLGGTNSYFSSNYEMVHLIVLNTAEPLSSNSPQLAWLRTDLTTANEQRASQPWIVIMGHEAPISTRSQGGNSLLQAALLPILDEFNVDLCIWGSIPSYERSHPTTDGVTYSQTAVGSLLDPYVGVDSDARGGTVHLVVGTGGSAVLDTEWKTSMPPAWSGSRDDSTNGFVKLCFDGARSLRGEFVDVENAFGLPLDEFFVCRTPPCAGTPGVYWNAVPETAADWRWTRTPPVGAAWRAASFNDAAWMTARAPLVASAANADATGTVLTGTGNSVWARRSFQVPAANLADVAEWEVLINAVDAADVYINGVLVDDALSQGLTLTNQFSRRVLLPANAIAAGSAAIAVQVTGSDFVLDVIVRARVGKNSATAATLGCGGLLNQVGKELDSCGVCGGDGGSCSVEFITPEQVMLHLTETPTEMVITWMTQQATTESKVLFGTAADALSMTQDAVSNRYTLGVYTSPFIHKATITGLTPGQKYHYRVSGRYMMTSTVVESDVFTFYVQNQDKNRDFCWLFLADMGATVNARNLAKTMENEDFSQVELILFGGDISYANGDTKASPNNIWDQWGRVVEPIARHTPWMYADGNHENTREPFTPYINRLPQPNSGFWYSFDYNSLHVIAISSEHPYGAGSPQLTWLENDLKTANANRANVPWIFLMAHRPPYNSNANYKSFTVLRSNIQPLMDQYGVDFAMFGHEHSYERTFPVKNDVVLSTRTGDLEEPYVGDGVSRGVMYFVVGTAGRGLRNSWIDPAPQWSRIRDATKYSYMRMCFNDSAKSIRGERILSGAGTVADTFYVCRDPPCDSIPASYCSDGMLSANIGETGVDCGGNLCGPCNTPAPTPQPTPAPTPMPTPFPSPAPTPLPTPPPTPTMPPPTPQPTSAITTTTTANANTNTNNPPTTSTPVSATTPQSTTTTSTPVVDMCTLLKDTQDILCDNSNNNFNCGNLCSNLYCLRTSYSCENTQSFRTAFAFRCFRPPQTCDEQLPLIVKDDSCSAALQECTQFRLKCLREGEETCKCTAGWISCLPENCGAKLFRTDCINGGCAFDTCGVVQGASTTTAGGLTPTKVTSGSAASQTSADAPATAATTTATATTTAATKETDSLTTDNASGDNTVTSANRATAHAAVLAALLIAVLLQ